MGMVVEGGNPKNRTDSGVVAAYGGTLLGFYVNSTSSGTLVLYDGSGTNGIVLSGTITPAIGWHRFPASFGTGLYVTIGSSLNVTFMWAPG